MLVVAALLAPALLLAGCVGGSTNTSDASGGTASGGTATRGTATVTVAPDSCPNVSGTLVATTGVLSAGPLSVDALMYQAGKERKFWVASQREGRDDAYLIVTDPAGVQNRQVRRSGEAFVSNAKQFYPGVIQLGVGGSYRIDIVVGSDSMCVVADFVVSASS